MDGCFAQTRDEVCFRKWVCSEFRRNASKFGKRRIRRIALFY